jgi:hypothetical protein
MSKSKKPVIQSVTVSRGTADVVGRIIAWDRPERATCQKGTPGCAIDHGAEDLANRRDRGCEGW